MENTEREKDREYTIMSELDTTMAFGSSSLGLNPIPIDINNLNKDFKTKEIVDKDVLD